MQSTSCIIKNEIALRYVKSTQWLSCSIPIKDVFENAFYFFFISLLGFHLPILVQGPCHTDEVDLIEF